MRIVIDLQACQSITSRDRGIGRYSLALAQAMVRHCSGHEFWLVLNDVLFDTIPTIYKEFETLLPPERIRLFNISTSISEIDPEKSSRRCAPEANREQLLTELNPDFVHVCSLFEGLHGDIVSTTEPRRFPSAVTLYDLIPLVHSERYLDGDDIRKRWYFRKLQALKRAKAVFAISEYSRVEAIERLAIPEESITTIGAGIDERFRPLIVTEEAKRHLQQKIGLNRRFVMYTGGMDWRKNIERLIEAFGLLPARVIQRYQLVIVGTAGDQERESLLNLARRRGLQKTDVVITGFVPDQDLIRLYNLCDLFVFPSLDEGFGLPVGEAMACGAAVIGSNTSSIPEVIGRSDALFDPNRSAAIAEAMMFALTNRGFKESLRQHGLVQARNFTWEKSAKSAVAALVEAHAKSTRRRSENVLLSARPKLAYVSPLPPQRSGIAAYSVELLPELASHYDIELIVDQKDVENPWLTSNFAVHDVEWFKGHASEFDYVLYHFGNSYFHKHMFELIQRVPGIVVLHDFYLSHVIHAMDHVGYSAGAFIKNLYYSHAYQGIAKAASEGEEAAVWEFPMNKAVLDASRGVIVHSEYAVTAAGKWYGSETSGSWHVIPQLRALPLSMDRKVARKELGISDEDFLVCSFGHVQRAKQLDRVLDAFLASRLAKDPRCHLAFVGSDDGRDYGDTLRQKVEAAALGGRIHVTGYTSTKIYNAFLSASDIAIQLRSLSRGETSRSVLDVLGHGIPLIANANGAMAELPQHCVTLLPDLFDNSALIAALEMLWLDEERREHMKKAARNWVRQNHQPARIGMLYRNAIMDSTLGMVSRTQMRNGDGSKIAGRRLGARRQLLLDISYLVKTDARTGVQRVVRSLMGVLLRADTALFRVEPVYYNEGRYHYARTFATHFVGCRQSELADAPISVFDGDVFLGIDLAPDIVPEAEPELNKLQAQGVKICFVVYDILPLLRTEWWTSEVVDNFTRWINAVVRSSNRLICISRATAETLREWVERHLPERAASLDIDHFHLGADFFASDPTMGFPASSSNVLSALGQRPTFLAVGTVEPRKGFAQLLTGFELLWDRGLEANLVVVGKAGWKVDSLVDRMRSLSQGRTCFFWIQEASDQYLQILYALASALIAASEGEGFGLPLIEAARVHVPIIARDLPVFREILDDNAYYFSGLSPEDLAAAVTSWLTMKEVNRAPMSSRVPTLTWRQSGLHLLELLTAAD